MLAQNQAGSDGILQFNPSVAQFLWHVQRADRTGLSRRVLDCAAGGANPPLALFRLRGFETCGIDISGEQVDRARAFAESRGMKLNIDVGDMRDIPFDNESFGYVYEWHSMCHLPHSEIERAVREMARVLQPGGYLYAEFMLESSWPRESGPTEEDDPTSAQSAHSYYAPRDIDGLLRNAGMSIVWSQERATRYPEPMEQFSLTEWLEWRREAFPNDDETIWRSVCPDRRKAHTTNELAVVCRKLQGV